MHKKIISYYYSKLLVDISLDKRRTFYLIIYRLWEKYFKNIYNPEIQVKINNKKLFMHLSHKLPFYYYRFQNFDRALPRICKKLKKIDSRLCVIDIGANIGATTTLMLEAVNGDFLCVEGDEKYLPILEKNLNQVSGENKIKIEKNYCGNEVERMVIERTNGTAKITSQGKNEKISPVDLKIKSLDSIINDNPYFRNSNLIKIDTDGFEINVLNSGKKFIKKSKPLIYFEFTPELYIKNNQDPERIWQILIECGYKKALFYDNFGNAVGVVKTCDKDKINNLINKINKKDVYYYDVLVLHEEKNRYLKILESELKLFI